MTTFILVLILSGPQGRGSISSIPNFKTEKECVQAYQKIKADAYIGSFDSLNYSCIAQSK